MADSEMIQAFKDLQAHLDSQLVAQNLTLKEFISSVDSRFADLQHGPGRPFAASSSRHPPDASTADVSPVFRSMKLAVPRFDGSDPSSWIFRVEEFFDFHNTPPPTRLRIAAFHMDGPAAEWFQWAKANHMLPSWQVFLTNLKQRFGGSLFDDPQGALSKLSQTASVAEFQSAFETLMNKVYSIPDDLLISFFITGLKSEIRREISMSRPATLTETFAVARAYESRIEDARVEARAWVRMPQRPMNPTPIQSVPHVSTSSPHTHTRPQPSVPLLPAPPTTTAPLPPSTTLPIRRLSPAEICDKCARGAFYNCDQRWSPSHRCRSQFLCLLGTDDAEDESLPPLEEDPEDIPDDSPPGDMSCLHSLSAMGKPQSLRFQGRCATHTFPLLIDSGSTHNFIKPSLAETLKLHTESIPPFRVYIGNGDYLTCRHKCPSAPLQLQGHSFSIDLFVLDIEGPHVVLGVQWLQQLGKVTHDYATPTMEFSWQGQPITLVGDSVPPSQEVTFHLLQAML